MVAASECTISFHTAHVSATDTMAVINLARTHDLDKWVKVREINETGTLTLTTINPACQNSRLVSRALVCSQK